MLKEKLYIKYIELKYKYCEKASIYNQLLENIILLMLGITHCY